MCRPARGRPSARSRTLTVVGEAFVAVSPKTDGFEKQAEKGILGAVSSVAKKAAIIAGGAFAADKAVEFFRSTIDSASDLNETISKNQVVFGEAAQQVLDFGETSAYALGQAKGTALEFTGVFGNLLRAVGLGPQQAAEMSTSLVQLGADLASFNNTSVEEALDALRSGLVGETEPLKRFGVNLNEATLKAKAMALGISDGTGVLDANAKAQAAYQLILEQTSLAQGDFARTSGGLANQQRILSATITDAKAKLGQVFLPAITSVVSFLTSRGVPAVEAFVRALGDKLQPALEVGKVVFGEIVGSVRAFVEAFKAGDGDITSSGLPGFFEFLGGTARGVWEALAPVRDALGEVRDAIAGIFTGDSGLAADRLGGLGEKLAPVGEAVQGLATLLSEVLAGALGSTADVLKLVGDNTDIVTDAVIAGAAAWAGYKTTLIAASVWEGTATAIGSMSRALEVARLQTQLFAGTSVAGNLLRNITGIGTTATAAVGPVSSLGSAAGSGGLAGALGFLSNPVTLIAAGIAALAAAAVLAYQHFQPFRDAVDAVGRAIADAFGWVVEFGKALFTLDFGKVGEMLKSLGSDILGLLSSLGELGLRLIDGAWEGLQALGQWIVGTGLPWLGEKALQLAGALWGWVREAVPAALAQLGEWLASLGAWLVGTAVPALVAKAAELGVALLSFIGSAIAAAPGKLGELLGTITAWAINAAVALPGQLIGLVEAVWSWIGPAVVEGGKRLLELLGTVYKFFYYDLPLKVVEWVRQVVPAVWSWTVEAAKAAPGQLLGILQALGDFFLSLPERVGAFITSGLPDLIRGAAGIGQAIIDGLVSFFTSGLPDLVRAGWGLLNAIGDGIVSGIGLVVDKGKEFVAGFLDGLLSNLSEGSREFLSSAAEFFTDLPGNIISGLGNLGELLVGWIGGAWDWVSANAAVIAQRYTQFWTSLPGKLLALLGNLGSLLVDWVSGAWDWVSSNAGTIARAYTDFWTSLPGKLIELLGNLGALIGGWISAGWDWVVENGPSLLATFLGWWVGLPGMILEALGNVGSFLWDNVFQPGLQLVYDNTVGKIGELIDWFKGLPGRIADAAGDVWGFLSEGFKQAINAVIGFWNGLRIPEFEIGPWEIPTSPWTTQSVGPFSIGGIDFPDIPQLATGGIVKARPGGGGGVVARVGEGMRDEAVMPLPPGFTEGLAAIAAGAGGGGVAPLIGQVTLQELRQPRLTLVALAELMRGVQYRGRP